MATDQNILQPQSNGLNVAIKVNPSASLCIISYLSNDNIYKVPFKLG